MLAQIFNDNSDVLREIIPLAMTMVIVLGVIGVVAMYFYYKSKKDKQEKK